MPRSTRSTPFFLLVLLSLATAACVEPGSDPTGPDVNPDPPPVDTRPPLGSFSFTRPSTIFQSLQSTVGSNAAVVRTFSLTESTPLVMRFATDYQAQIAIMPASEATAFSNFQSVSVVESWEGGAGTKSLTLGAGSYAIGIRSNQPVSQKFSWELDRDIISLPTEHGYSFDFGSYVMSEAMRVDANGGRAWHGFTIQPGNRYFIDGTNTRVEAYLIPSDQLSAFQNGQSFQFYSDYGATAAGAPGLWEISLPPGSYYLAMLSTDAEVDGYVTYTMERWAIR